MHMNELCDIHFYQNWIKDTKLKHAFIEKIINVPIQNKLL